MALDDMSTAAFDYEIYSQANVSATNLAETNVNKSTLLDAQEFSQLRTQATRLEHLLQVMPAGVIVIDGRGVVRQANQQALELLGEPLEGEVWRNIIRRSFAPQADDGHEVSLRDGRKVKLSITPLVNEPGQLIVITDLTETRQLQQRISHMQRLSSLGNMVASLAHQIRTPLSAAMLYAANLANKTMAPEARDRFSDKLQSRLRDLEMQVNDMLLFAKSGEQQVVTELSMQALLSEVEAGSEAMLSRYNGLLDVILPEPDIQVLGNKTALAGALQNLIHNALQMIPDSPRIIMTAQCDSKDADWLELVISDNGPGIPEDKLKQVFAPFYTTRSQGTGLGLAVVQAVAKSHHGQVSVTNNSSGGACFTLRLPRYCREQHAANNSESLVTGARQ